MEQQQSQTFLKTCIVIRCIFLDISEAEKDVLISRLPSAQ